MLRVERANLKYVRFFRAFEWAVASAASIAVVFVIVQRSISVPLTYDESYSLGIALGQSDPTIANNHWLNTALMKVALYFFGGGGFDEVIRIPNVVAGIVYFAAVISILRYLVSWQARWVLFAVAALNPFVIEFFSIGRGYGLALTFIAVSFSLLLGITKSKTRSQVTWTGIGALTCLTLAFYSSFGTLVLVLIMGLSAAVFAWLELDRVGALTLKASAKRWASVWVVASFFPFLLSLIPGVIELFRLRQLGLLYYGGDADFFSDSIQSFSFEVLRSSGISDPLFVQIGSWAILIVGIIAVVALLTSFLRSGSKVHIFLVALLAGFPLAHTVLNAALGVNYPISRTLIPTLIVFALGIALALDIVVARLRKKLASSLLSLAAVGALVASAYGFIGWVNFTHTSEWRYDAGSRDVALLVANEIALNKQLVLCPADITAQNSLVAVSGYFKVWEIAFPVVNCQDGGDDPGHDILISFPDGHSGLFVDYVNPVSGVEVLTDRR